MNDVIVPVVIETTEAVATRLDRLAATGFYGKDRSAVAEELVRIALRDHCTPDFVLETEDDADDDFDRRKRRFRS